MSFKTPRILIALVVPALLAASRLQAEDTAEEGFQSLFNGADLTGWEGVPDAWGVRDGAIVTKPGGLKNFLIWKDGKEDGVVEDFELRLKFRIEAGNSGVQFRSKRFFNKKKQVPAVGGPQADLAAGNVYTGSLYGEGMKAFGPAFRGIEITHERRVKPEMKPKGEWNEYVVIADGPRVTLKVNGTTTVDTTLEKGPFTGILAFQHHGGNTQIEIKDIRIKVLDRKE